MLFAFRRLAVAVLILAASSAYAAVDLRLHISDNSSPGLRPFVGQYSFFMVNDGTDTSAPVKLKITFPSFLSFEKNQFDNTWSCVDNGGGSVTCTGRELQAKHGMDLYFFLRSDAPPLGTYQVVGEVDVPDDPTPANNRAVSTQTFFRAFQVTNNGDSGPGTLRDAIEQANAICTDGSFCKIDLISNDEFIVHLLSPLPPVTACNLTIDPQSYHIDFGHRRLQLDGTRLPQGNGLEIRTACPAGVPGVSVFGLGIGGFPENGLVIASQDADPRPEGTCHLISTNVFGLDRTAKEVRPNGLRGVSVESGRACVDLNRNLIGGNVRSGVTIWAAAPGTMVRNNKVGWGVFPVPLGNGGSGIFIAADDVTVSGNNIAFNREWGISIFPGVKQAGIRANTIHSNGEIAIDWGLDRRPHNDPDETDGVPNAPRITNIVTRNDVQFGRPVKHGYVEGVVRSRTGVYGSKFVVNLYINGAPDLSGRHEAFLLARTIDVVPPNEGTFEASFRTHEIPNIDGDTFTAQLVVFDATGKHAWSSELGEPFKVP